MTTKMNIITNYDIQQILNDKTKLFELQKHFENVKPGAGEIPIHLYAFKCLLDELAAYKR